MTTSLERFRSRWSASQRSGLARNVERGRALGDEIAAEFTTEELLDFLEADQRPSVAEPGFKEDLREELWAMLSRRREQ